MRGEQTGVKKGDKGEDENEGGGEEGWQGLVGNNEENKERMGRAEGSEGTKEDGRRGIRRGRSVIKGRADNVSEGNRKLEKITTMGERRRREGER